MTDTNYRTLALDLVDEVVNMGEHWLATSGFENADHCINDLDDTTDYWELVYVSIASNMDDYLPGGCCEHWRPQYRATLASGAPRPTDRTRNAA